MTNLLLKNGIGTEVNRDIFKSSRSVLSPEQQRTLATALGLQLVDNTIPVVPPAPTLHKYRVMVQVPIIVEAENEEQAKRNWYDASDSDSLDRDDVEVVSATLLEEHEEDEDAYLNDYE
jgi:hypothetical protein